MSLQKIIEKIKVYLTEEVAVKLTDVKTKDGIILNFDGELSVGTEIFIVAENGSTPAPDAEYILEDGSKIKVVEGKVDEIIAPEASVEPAPEAPVAEVAAEEAPVEAPAEAPVEAPVAEKIAALENQIKEIYGILAELVDSLNKDDLKEEIKVEMAKVQPVVKQFEGTKIKNTDNTVSNILLNMYKK